ncbi:NUDIX hydrolase domain-like protein [Cantharellus anzutake]|uniref:NUDIX hydrolase domain-like protein n=1 Tax=Cantharellus anzutake TaxID=1750568 RepID=UPI001907556F|nr:NUDIX hydrolase domain-like protein [Cantharellus anzutake]KAF8340590.1 NUDIX hydrolase domain-like protein [Cantharellus anzutake]
MPKQRSTPRVVCCAIPIARTTGQILLITSRKRGDQWVFPKGGFEPTDQSWEAAASREALEEAGVRGVISRRVTTIQAPAAIYHVFELEVTNVEADWLEKGERRREWVDYATACSRLQWKPELLQGLMLSTLAQQQR